MSKKRRLPLPLFYLLKSPQQCAEKYKERGCGAKAGLHCGIKEQIVRPVPPTLDCSRANAVHSRKRGVIVLVKPYGEILRAVAQQGTFLQGPYRDLPGRKTGISEQCFKLEAFECWRGRR